MAGIAGIIQGLEHERDAKRAALDALVQEGKVEIEALDLAIEVIKTAMNGHLTRRGRKAPENQFAEGTLSWYAVNVLVEAGAPLSVREIYRRISGGHPCSESGVSTAIYGHQDVFQKIREGVFQLAAGEE